VKLESLANVLRCASYGVVGSVPTSPLMVYVELTRRCNLACRHCDIWKIGKRVRDLRKQEVPASVLLETFREMRKRGLVAVDLFGGEPLLREDVVEIVAGARAIGLHVTITTNGTLLAADLAGRLAAAGLSQLLVSIDGPTAAVHDGLRGKKGAFDLAVKGISHSLGQRVGVNTLVCRETIDTLAEMPGFAAGLGASQLRLLPYHQCYPFNTFGTEDSLRIERGDVPRLTKALAAMRREAVRHGVRTNSESYLRGIVAWYAGRRQTVRCMAGLGVCDINAMGEVYPCYTLGKSAGNIKERSFLDIWNQAALRPHREGTRTCRGCWQSCYIEPGLRLSPKAMLTDWRTAIADMREYGR